MPPFFLPLLDKAVELEEEDAPPGTATVAVLVKATAKSPMACEAASASAKLNESKYPPPCTSEFSTVSMYYVTVPLLFKKLSSC